MVVDGLKILLAPLASGQNVLVKAKGCAPVPVDIGHFVADGDNLVIFEDADEAAVAKGGE